MILLDIPYGIVEKILMENSHRANRVFRIGKGELVLRRLAISVVKLKMEHYEMMRTVATRFDLSKSLSRLHVTTDVDCKSVVDAAYGKIV